MLYLSETKQSCINKLMFPTLGSDKEAFIRRYEELEKKKVKRANFLTGKNENEMSKKTGNVIDVVIFLT